MEGSGLQMTMGGNLLSLDCLPAGGVEREMGKGRVAKWNLSVLFKPLLFSLC